MVKQHFDYLQEHVVEEQGEHAVAGGPVNAGGCTNVDC